MWILCLLMLGLRFTHGLSLGVCLWLWSQERVGGAGDGVMGCGLDVGTAFW